MADQRAASELSSTSGESAPPPDLEGRRTAFAEIARQVEGPLLRTARRLCGANEDVAQDLAQETLVRGYGAYMAGQFHEGGNARAWLSRILMNLFVNDYRRRVKWDAGVNVETLTAGGETGPEATRAAAGEVPGASLLRRTLDEPLERALLMLSESLRTVVLLVDIEEFTYEEAARTLKIPIGTVRSRISRARYQLQDLLHAYAKERRLI